MRDSMIFYKGWLNALKNTPPEQFKEAMLAILEYGIEGVEYEGDGFGEIILNMARGQIDANNQRYENGQKGGRPKNHTKENEKPLVIETENHRLSESKPNVNVNDNVNENVNENVNVNEDVNVNAKEKGAKAPKKKSYFPNDEKLDETFAEYVEMRKKIRATLTDRGVELAISKLNTLSRGDPEVMIAILNQSIMNSWKGLFELHDKPRKENVVKDDDYWANL